MCSGREWRCFVRALAGADAALLGAAFLLAARLLLALGTLLAASASYLVSRSQPPIYLHARAYILEPQFSLTVETYSQPRERGQLGETAA